MAAEIRIDIATVDDAAAVASVLEASYPELMRPAYDIATLQRALPAMVVANPILLRSGTYYVARQRDGAVVGCGGWTREGPATNQVETGTGHIRHFAILPRCGRRGIGRQIYQACEMQARSNGVTTFEVLASLNGLPFYAALGFVRLEDINVALGSGLSFPAIRMRRQIHLP